MSVAKKKYPKFNKNGTLRAPPPAPLGHKRSVGNNGGRPTDYKPEYVEQVRQLCQIGATDVEVARFFKIGIRTLYYWQAAHPKFLQAMKIGKGPVDDRVERSFLQRAVGYDYPIDPNTKHIPGDVTAQMKWLCNRRPKEWRERMEHTHEIRHEMTTEEALEDLLAVLAEYGVQLALPPPTIEGESEELEQT